MSVEKPREPAWWRCAVGVRGARTRNSRHSVAFCSEGVNQKVVTFPDVRRYSLARRSQKSAAFAVGRQSQTRRRNSRKYRCQPQIDVQDRPSYFRGPPQKSRSHRLLVKVRLQILENRKESQVWHRMWLDSATPEFASEVCQSERVLVSAGLRESWFVEHLQFAVNMLRCKYKLDLT